MSTSSGAKSDDGSLPAAFGSGVLFLSAAFLTLMGVQVKALTALLPASQRIPDVEVTWARFAIGLVVMLVAAASGRMKLRTQRLGGLLARGVVGTVAIGLYFYAITHAPLGIGTLLSYTYLIFGPLFSALWLRERPSAPMILGLAIAAAGVALLAPAGHEPISSGVAAGLLSGVFSGMAVTAIRDLRRTEPAPLIFLSLSLVGTVVFGGFMLAGFAGVSGIQRPVVPHGNGAWLLLAGVGLTSVIGQLILTWGFRYVSTALGTLISVTAVPLSMLAGAALFHEHPTPRALFGAALVLTAGAVLSVLDRAKAVPRKAGGRQDPLLSSIEAEAVSDL
jgi:S-adenosylmethionine uptake transporter